MLKRQIIWTRYFKRLFFSLSIVIPTTIRTNTNTVILPLRKFVFSTYGTQNITLIVHFFFLLSSKKYL